MFLWLKHGIYIHTLNCIQIQHIFLLSFTKLKPLFRSEKDAGMALLQRFQYFQEISYHIFSQKLGHRDNQQIIFFSCSDCFSLLNFFHSDPNISLMIGFQDYDRELHIVKEISLKMNFNFLWFRNIRIFSCRMYYLWRFLKFWYFLL